MKKYIILLLLLTSCNNNTPSTIPFTLKNNLPMVEGSINNIPTTFIIDSGANISVINTKTDSIFNFTIDKTTPPNYINGVTSSQRLYNLNNVSIDIGDEKLNIKAKGINLSNVNLVGIIGTDYLIKNEIIINFKNKTITVN